MKTIKTIMNAVEDFVLQIQINRMKKQALNKKFDSMTDPTFLDRVAEGEAKHA